ncbi:MAG: hypothetical protein A2075_04665 [Geobacteraceae bacterium GWC2_58_44]|nr:MAG: hypothetical protein A2075_04665 [Geobacteraceae bacterium GWC2_58_44]HBG06859.1 hypothetical protein [Geobacter sp.]
MRKKMFSAAPFMKRVAPALLVSAFLLPLPARAEIKAGSVELSPFAGYSFFQDRQNLENGPILGGRIGYNFTGHFGVEVTGQYVNSGVDDKSRSFTRQGEFTSPIDDVDIAMYHLDLIYHFMPESRFNPYVTAGYGAAHYSPKINNKNMSIIGAGVGAKYWVAENVALRVDVRDNMTTDEHIHNVESSVGVVLRFGGKSNAVVARAAQPVDSDSDGDGDGVSDALDRCPGTPSGVAIGSDGCPIDNDRDGVADYLDKCPATPAGAAVDQNGCPPAVILAPVPNAVQTAVVVAEPQVIVLSFEDIHFDFDQSTLKPEAKAILDRNILLLKENPKARIRIAGYTSASGTEEYNQKLSERRADSVRSYLVSEGVIGSNRLTTIGYGETRPMVNEPRPTELHSEAAQANIRVLFEITVQ